MVSGLYLEGRIGEALDVLAHELAQGGARCPLLALQVDLQLQAGRTSEAAAGFEPAIAPISGPDVAPAAALTTYAHLVQYANHVGEVDVAADLLNGWLTSSSTGRRRSPSPPTSSPPSPTGARGCCAGSTSIWLRRGAFGPTRPRSIGGTFEAGRARAHWISEWDEALELIQSASFDLDQRGATVGSELLLAAAAEILLDRGDLDEAQRGQPARRRRS